MILTIQGVLELSAWDLHPSLWRQALTVLMQMLDLIVDAPDPEQVILFGSWAKGEGRADSDVDLLVVESEPFGPHRSRRGEIARLWRVLFEFDFPKDILVYSREEVLRRRDCRSHVVGRALREGKVLYERSGESRGPGNRSAARHCEDFCHDYCS
ncbi:MAG: nucleotidyltransferase domain-containing protein [Thermodesulfobacteriota bacterium]